MPDWWVRRYRLGNLIDDASGEPDADNSDNLVEFQAGTNPLVSDLVPAATPEVIPMHVTTIPDAGSPTGEIEVLQIQWTGMAGADYQFETSSDLEYWRVDAIETATSGTDLLKIPTDELFPVHKKFFCRLRIAGLL